MSEKPLLDETTYRLWVRKWVNDINEAVACIAQRSKNICPKCGNLSNTVQGCWCIDCVKEFEEAEG